MAKAYPMAFLDGTNKTFFLTNNGTILTSIPHQVTVWDNSPLVPEVGYALSLVDGQVQVSFSVAPQRGDTLFSQGVM
jgi:hypothetical protein